MGALACLWLYFAINITYGIVVLGYGIVFGCYYLSRRLGYLSRWKATTQDGGDPGKISIFHFLSRPYLTACVRRAGIRSGEGVWYSMAMLPYYLMALTVVVMLGFMVVSVITDLVG
ncbi:hypothetical protein [Raineyella fluvialis]|uniref:Uncharacterized protein n=1 Tax=Raineyella fluvialis TaxID=2662261 RepID=A0A5Q2FCW1_9ACTN|nr:hypothetical protein [Raineyella fluvialis]QGF23597.1 hypothetical protein Rai3103_07870 [Raineyella fluvialis]